MSATVPPAGTVERWCFDLVTTRELERKLAPPSPPETGSDASWWDAEPLRIAAPGRPDTLRLTARSPRTPRAGALRDTGVREVHASASTATRDFGTTKLGFGTSSRVTSRQKVRGLVEVMQSL